MNRILSLSFTPGLRWYDHAAEKGGSPVSFLREFCGMNFPALDTKEGLARNYGTIVEKHYGYQVSIIDLRNPTRLDGFNFLTLANAYMDRAVKHPDGDSGSYGEDAFLRLRRGLLIAVILLLAEFLPLREIDGQPRERRHIISVFKLVQDLLEPSGTKRKSCFQVLMSRLPSEHKVRWFAGAALNTSEQAMASVLSLFSAGWSRRSTMLPIIQRYWTEPEKKETAHPPQEGWAGRLKKSHRWRGNGSLSSNPYHIR